VNVRRGGGKVDTTPEYVRMVDCPEIQGQRPRRVIYDRERNKYESHSFFVARGDAEPSCECGKYGRSWYGEIACDKCGTIIEPLIWLPRQDQLQEMAGPEWWRQWERFRAFVYCRCQDQMLYSSILPSRRLGSMEQLWLAFVMAEKFGKTWDGNEWRENVQGQLGKG
jgi:hypothetical protein